MARTGYLALYNGLQCVAWTAILVRAVSALLSTSPPEAGSVYAACGRAVSVAQAATFLETLHALFGLVHSAVAGNVFQFVGRGHAWLLVTLYPALQRHNAAAVLVLTWSLSDCVRYAWATESLASSPTPAKPSLLTYLRYTLFLALFPLGAGAEWVLTYLARSEVAGGKLSLPNQLNFAFDYRAFLVVFLAAQPVFFYTLYAHMLRQRRRKLGCDAADEKKTA